MFGKDQVSVGARDDLKGRDDDGDRDRESDDRIDHEAPQGKRQCVCRDGREHEGIPEIVDVGEADLRLLNTVGGFADHLVDPARLRQHRDVASR